MPVNSDQIPGAGGFLLFFTRKLRLSNPWNYKAPSLICVPYLLFLLSAYHGTGAFMAILCSLCVIVGVAGTGYLSNDLGDRKQDAILGRSNATAGLGHFAIAMLFLLFLALALLPWNYLPFNGYSAFLLALEFSLFLLYALPPFRLKERGLAGLIADALYAHVVPALLAAYTFLLFTGGDEKTFLWFICFLLSWQMVLGLRNILFHQLKDRDDDLASGTLTFVTARKPEDAARLARRLLCLETALFTALLIYLFASSPISVLLVALYWITLAVKKRKELKQLNYRRGAYLFLDDLYVKWLPLFVLLTLCVRSVDYVSMLLLHVVVFRNDIKYYLINRVFKKS